MNKKRYELIPNGRHNYTIHEVASGNNVITYACLSQARTMTHRLERGYGFDGWTPGFISQGLVN